MIEEKETKGNKTTHKSKKQRRHKLHKFTENDVTTVSRQQHSYIAVERSLSQSESAHDKIHGNYG